MKKENYTIIHIAKLSGFSKATVSKVIRNKPYVKKSTREKIQKIIREIGYQPNEIARSLVSKKNMNFIGLIISDINNSFFSEVALGVESEVKKRGYNVILCNTNYSEEEEKKYIDILLRYRATGLILTTPTYDDKNLDILNETNYPFVLITRKVKDLDSNIVSVNHFKSAKMAVNYLIKKGHKEIAHFTAKENTIGVINRLKGYEAALKDNNIRLNQKLIFKSNTSSIECGYDLAKKLLASTERPSAIFASDDLLAIGARDYFLEKGFKIPEDFSIVGYDNIKITSLKSIDLTTIDQPKFEMGVKAVEILFKQITDRENFETVKYYFDTKIMERGSVRDIN